jgi:hypothetical protein
MERANITNADPARSSRIDPVILKSVLEQISKSKLTFETVGLGESGSELQLSFGTFPDAVEVTLAIVDSHEAAVTRMRRSLTYISAPLDATPIPLGQYSLQDGDSCVLFVRGNVFVKITRSAACVELATIAAEIDKFLKEREGDLASLPKPRLESSGAHGRVVKVGETFEVELKVVDAGSMTAFTDVGIAQLLEMDVENGIFKFYATTTGTVDIQLIFAHMDTLQTTTATVQVEVVDDGSESAQRLGELHV